MRDLTKWGVIERGEFTASGHAEILARFRTRKQAEEWRRNQGLLQPGVNLVMRDTRYYVDRVPAWWLAEAAR